MIQYTHKINFMVNGLYPNKKYKFYLGELDISSKCLPMHKDYNFDSVYTYYLNNSTRSDLDIDGNPIQQNSKDILENIFFEAYSRNADATLNSNVIKYGNLGDDLIADLNGSIVFSVYLNDNKLDLSLNLKGSGVRVEDTYSTANKYFILKDLSGNELVKISPVESYKNRTNLDKNVKTL